MQTISMMTQLNNPDQRGGAYLRVDAIRRIYESLGFKPELHYQDNFKTKHTLKSLWNSYKYNPKTRLLFKTSTSPIPDGDFLHLDNLRHFNWQYNPSIPILFNAHNLEFENYFNRVESDECKRFREYEFQQMNRAKCIWLCSDREKNILNKHLPETGNKSLVIPNLVDKNHYSSGEKKYISFIGTLDYYPNVLAVDYILDVLIPEIQSQDLDNLNFIIAGRNPTQEQIQKCKEKQVELRSDLSQAEILKLFSETKILIVPLTEGSGTRLKILEAIFSNSLVVSTPLGAEGIESKNIVLSEISNFPSSLTSCIQAFKNKDLDFEASFLNNFDIESWTQSNKDLIYKAITK